MSLNLWLALAKQDTAANRPTAPEVPTGCIALFYATDTNALSVYANGAWHYVDSITSTATGITAGTTQTIAGATQLSAGYNNVSTVANANDAVKLPAATIGTKVFVSNSGAAAAKVFPQAATDVIDALSAGAAATLTNGKSALFTCIAAGVWQSIGMATRSA
jgi:hypothetical protein